MDQVIHVDQDGFPYIDDRYFHYKMRIKLLEHSNTLSLLSYEALPVKKNDVMDKLEVIKKDLEHFIYALGKDVTLVSFDAMGELAAQVHKTFGTLEKQDNKASDGW